MKTDLSNLERFPKIIPAALIAFLFIFPGLGKHGLDSFDDCFYAQKGYEMSKNHIGYTITWNHEHTSQHPPLQFIFIALSFRLFGKNDFAAVLPSAIMGFFICLLVFLTGKQIRSETLGFLAVLLLITTNYFLQNCQRVMLDIPLTFWVTLFFFLLIFGQKKHPSFSILLAFPFGAGILTKSVLGILPFIITIFWLLIIRPSGAKTRWILWGLFLGILLGLTWPLYEWLKYGWEEITAHFVGEVWNRSVERIEMLERAVFYPKMIWRFFQPWVIPGVISGLWILSRQNLRKTPAGLISLWLLLPVIFYSVSSAQEIRYLTPILPPLCLASAFLFILLLRKFRHQLVQAALVIIPVIAAFLHWIDPAMFYKPREKNLPLRLAANLIQSRVPEKNPVVNILDQKKYFYLASPLLYYAERTLNQTPCREIRTALSESQNINGKILFCEPSQSDTIRNIIPGAEIIQKDPCWTLLDLK
ncbi:MAG: glycosyltransferase family 39 protein [Candidatus Aureabacteria bacterium]|nr:glycosyltransferase family 39 protein [Candidatus Auribacterota bacterium]